MEGVFCGDGGMKKALTSVCGREGGCGGEGGGGCEVKRMQTQWDYFRQLLFLLEGVQYGGSCDGRDELGTADKGWLVEP